MSNELLTLKNLKQYFPVGKDRFVRAVDGVDLTINHGDVMGLVGCLLYTSPSPRD